MFSSACAAPSAGCLLGCNVPKSLKHQSSTAWAERCAAEQARAWAAWSLHAKTGHPRRGRERRLTLCQPRSRTRASPRMGRPLCPICPKRVPGEEISREFSRKSRFWPCQHAFRPLGSRRVLMFDGAWPRPSRWRSSGREGGASWQRAWPGCWPVAYPARVGCGMYEARRGARSRRPKGEP